MRDVGKAMEGSNSGTGVNNRSGNNRNVSDNIGTIDTGQNFDTARKGGESEKQTANSNFSNVFCSFEGEDTSVLVGGFINRKKVDLLIDTGAGPCVIDMGTIGKLGNENAIDISEAGKQLNGLGNARVIGTIKLDVFLHSHLKQSQVFKVVEDIGGIILLGRKFLSKFKSLQINWREMTLVV